MKFSIKNLTHTTPRSLRRFGNALAATGTSLAGIAFLTDYKSAAIATIVATGAGTFIANCFKEDTPNEENK